MKYCEKYKDVKLNLITEVEPDIIVASADGPCAVCECESSFESTKYECYVCSEKCLEELANSHCADCAGCPEYCWDDAEVLTTVCSKCMKIIPRMERVIEYEASNGVFLKAIKNTCLECRDVTWSDWYQVNGIENPKVISRQ